MSVQSPVVIPASDFLPSVSAAQLHISTRLLGRTSSNNQIHIAWLGVTTPKINGAALIAIHDVQESLAIFLHSHDPVSDISPDDKHERLLGYIFAAGDVIRSIEALTEIEFARCQLMNPPIEANTFDIGVIAQVSSEKSTPKLVTFLLSSKSVFFERLLRVRTSVDRQCIRKFLPIPLKVAIPIDGSQWDLSVFKPHAWVLLHPLCGKSTIPLSLTLPTGETLCDALYDYASQQILISNTTSKLESEHLKKKETKQLKREHVESSDSKMLQDSSTLLQAEQRLAINSRVVVELGTLTLSIEELLAITPGQIFPLGKQLSDRYVIIKAYDKVIAHGDLVLLGDAVCVRIAIVESGHESV
jgi:flagellar motor switch/type III secretory pathway protein FliN